MKPQPFNLEPGRSLGSNYDIVEFIGGGWEGEVYKIKERKTGIYRAAKLFYDRDGSRQPLLKYAKKLNKLKDCPIIIQYHHRDTARVRGKVCEFLVADFIEGLMLSEFLKMQKKKRLSSFEALRLLYDITIGIEPIHFRGEYHGDIHSDNILVRRKGLGFDVHLIDFYDLGRPSKERIQDDVFSLIQLLHEVIGGVEGYCAAGYEVRQIVMGRKRGLIAAKFKNAGHLRLALENLNWNE
jgi:serine/threonine protein kinase